MTVLARKLWRDLWRLRGQVVAIAMVMATGVAMLIMSLGALQALQDTANAFYERGRFAQVFAGVKRAPELLRRRVEALPGVQSVQTRIAEFAVLDVAGFEEPVIGQLISIPERGQPALNRLVLRSGRSVAPGRPDEVVLSEAFAEAHGLTPGDHLFAVMNGRKRRLDVVGTTLSPEFVYAIAPGGIMPDDERFGVLFLGREALAAAYDLDGAFNDVSLSLLRGANVEEVISRLDSLLAPYGGVGAYPRKDQLSHFFLMNEINQLANMAGIMPTIFLAVAAFLTHMVLGRLIAVERSEIGLLKAFGYSNTAVGWHYVQLVLAMGTCGVALGFALGWWSGRAITDLYAEFFRFPFVLFRPSPSVFVGAAAISLGAALAGTVQAVRGAIALPPAEAMRPPSPTSYTRSRASAWLEKRVDRPTRMILRQVARWPARSFATIFGVAMATALLVTAFQWVDAINVMIRVHFFESQHQDATISLVDARSSEVERSLAGLPGVLDTEPVRIVPARLRAGPRSRREAVQGVARDAHLAPVYDADGGVLSMPPDGLVLSTKLASLLAVRPGDPVTVEVLEGHRPVFETPVAAVFETYLGTPAMMDLSALNRAMRERPSVSAAHLTFDPARRREFFAAIKDLPAVSAVTLRSAAIESFEGTMAESMLTFIGFFSIFSGMLAFGVIYNAARVGLSERARELATLRVLGLSRMEISYILVGELGVLTAIALPAGCVAGYGLAWLFADAFETELFRIPLVVLPATFGTSVLITLAAAVVSAAIVRRRLDRLDLISVLKTRE